MEEKLALKPRRQGRRMSEHQFAKFHGIIFFPECPKSGSPSGVYTLYGLSYPEGLRVYCDTETAGGEWIVRYHYLVGSSGFTERGSPSLVGRVI